MHLRRGMKSTHAASGSGDNMDCKPDVMTYMMAIAGCSKAREYAHTLSLIAEMRREGIQPNGVTFSAAINTCTMASAKLARRHKEEDASSGVHGNINVNGDDTIAVLKDGKGQVVGGSATQQRREQHPQVTGRDKGGRNTNGQQCEGTRQPIQGPNGVGYRLAILVCARLPGRQCWKDGVHLLCKMKSTHVTSGGGNDVDCKPDVMAYMMAIAGCFEVKKYVHVL
jgi:pentatricopeptide repeat protein